MSFDRVQICLLMLRRLRRARTGSLKYSSSSQPPPVSNEPVKYTTSEAAAWRAQQTRSGSSRSSDPHLLQVLSVTTSMMAFMLYFCVIREENDLDEALFSPIYDSVDGLEEAALKIALQHELDGRGDTSKIVERLNQLEREKKVSSGNAP